MCHSDSDDVASSADNNKVDKLSNFLILLAIYIWY